MVDSANRDAILQIESRIDKLMEDPTNNEQGIRELKSLREILLNLNKEDVESTQNLTNPPPPPAAANSSSTMVDFSKSDVIDIIESRIDRIDELQAYPSNREHIISELENLIKILTNPHPRRPAAANSILTMVDSANRDAILQIESRIDKLKEDPTTNKEVIRELERLSDIFFRLYKEDVDVERRKTMIFDEEAFEKMIEKTCVVDTIVNLLSFASPEHSLFNPDMLFILPDGDPMLLLTKDDLDSIHQFVSKPDDCRDLHIMRAISSFCINAKSWLERNPGVNDLSVSLNKIIHAIDNAV
jgi:hypothetical protein